MRLLLEGVEIGTWNRFSAHKRREEKKHFSVKKSDFRIETMSRRYLGTRFPL